MEKLDKESFRKKDLDAMLKQIRDDYVKKMQAINKTLGTINNSRTLTSQKVGK